MCADSRPEGLCRQFGIATLEAALLSAVMLPLFLGLFIVAWYLYETSVIRSALSRTMHEFSANTLHVTMARMDGWLRTRHVELEAELQPLAEMLRSQAKQQLGLGDSEDHSIRVDVAVGFGAFAVDTHTGAILRPGIRRAEGPLGNERRVSIVTFPPHEWASGLRAPEPDEITEESPMLTFAALRLLAPQVLPNGDFAQPAPGPSPFSLASGHYGTRLQLHYGPSHTYGSHISHHDNRADEPVSDYLRTTMVMGCAIIVDFSDSFVGKVLRYFPARTVQTPNGRRHDKGLATRITTVDVMPPRIDF